MKSKLTSVEQIDSFTEQTIAQVDEYLRGQREHERRELQCDPQYLAWAEEQDRADEQYWAEHCQQHGTELGEGGFCALCVQEERIADL